MVARLIEPADRIRVLLEAGVELTGLFFFEWFVPVTPAAKS
jgi:hypothetical protein